MTNVAMTPVGSVDVVDLTVISRHHGRDFIPFPFMQTHDTGIAPEAFEAHAAGVLERFEHGDLRDIRHWAATYVRGDIRVEAHVQYVPAETANVRVVAHRMGDTGYFARQTDADVIEISSLSPYDLGGAVAEAMGTEKPGSKRAIVIPEYHPRASPRIDQDSVFPVSRRRAEAAVTVSRGEVAALATVQSHWRPTRKWGVDRGKNALAWVRVRDDGDYLYAPDFAVARPMSTARLSERVDRLIAEDVAVLRRYRHDR